MTKIWNKVYEPVTSKEMWVGEIWVEVDGASSIVDTILDPDRQMFYHWLTHYTNKVAACFDDNTDLEMGAACYLGA
ncbi:hypothetical protein N9M17_00665 [bacterium]|jgi:hypothetical protein|nr:hypothetical protein [bacterium]MDB4741073.1 hypothetical protein [Akkermansiaceae bacterium]